MGWRWIVMTGRLLWRSRRGAAPVGMVPLERQSSPMTAARAGIQGVVTTHGEDAAAHPRDLRPEGVRGRVAGPVGRGGCRGPPRQRGRDARRRQGQGPGTRRSRCSTTSARSCRECRWWARKSTVKTSSRDPVLHTTVVQQPDGRQLFNVALPVPGMEIAKPLAGTGALRVGCSTHQWMRGWILVTDDVAAVTRRRWPFHAARRAAGHLPAPRLARGAEGDDADSDRDGGNAGHGEARLTSGDAR